MKTREKIFYCNQCKKILHKDDKIFFVEQGHQRSFCSEKCTTRFFGPLMKYLEEEENEFRKELEIEQDFSLEQEDWEYFVEEALKGPDEIWMDVQETTERIFYFLNAFEHTTHGPFTMILAVLFSEHGPGFVLWQTVTQVEAMVALYRSGEKVQDWQSYRTEEQATGEREANLMDQGAPSSESMEGEQEGSLDSLMLNPKDIEFIEGRRGSLLAKLMEERSDEDIPYEAFGQYEGHLQTTLEMPDEIYRQVEQDGEILFTYIKSFQGESTPFFYFVVCLPLRGDNQSGEETLVPIISFPSVDGELYFKYKKGEKISGVLKN